MIFKPNKRVKLGTLYLLYWKTEYLDTGGKICLGTSLKSNNLCPLGPRTQILGKPLTQLRLAGPESLNRDFAWGRKIMNFLVSIR